MLKNNQFMKGMIRIKPLKFQPLRTGPLLVKPLKMRPINLRKDSDKDGVPDYRDCQPYNPKKQGIFHLAIGRYAQTRGRRKEQKAVDTQTTAQFYLAEGGKKIEQGKQLIAQGQEYINYANNIFKSGPLDEKNYNKAIEMQKYGESLVLQGQQLVREGEELTVKGNDILKQVRSLQTTGGEDIKTGEQLTEREIQQIKENVRAGLKRKPLTKYGKKAVDKFIKGPTGIPRMVVPTPTSPDYLRRRKRGGLLHPAETPRDAPFPGMVAYKPTGKILQINLLRSPYQDRVSMGLPYENFRPKFIGKRII